MRWSRGQFAEKTLRYDMLQCACRMRIRSRVMFGYRGSQIIDQGAKTAETINQMRFFIDQALMPP